MTAPAATPGPYKGLGLPVKLGWASGTLGTVTLLYLVNFFLLFFLTDVLGVGAAAAGLILFSVRLYDMATDPIVGALSDRTRSRWGRRRPWMLVGALLSAASCVLIFAVPEWAIQSGYLALYLGAALVCYFTGYTFFNVPYLAMPAEMSPDYQERTSIMSYRVFFVAVAGIVATAGAPVLVEALGSGRAGFRGMAWIMAGVIFTAMIVAVYMTGGVHRTRRQGPSLPFSAAWRTIVANRPFLLLIGIKLLQLFALACSSAGLLFFVKYVLQRGTSTAGLVGLLANTASILALPLWMRVAKLAPKHIVYALATVGQILLTMSWLLASADEPAAVLWVRALLLGTFAAGIILMGQSLLPDVIEHDHRLSGVRREGLLAAMYSFVEKTSFAVSPLVIGPFLAYMGYQASAGATIQQSDSAVTAIYIVLGVMPPAAYLLSIPLLLSYKLTESALKAAGSETSGVEAEPR